MGRCLEFYRKYKKRILQVIIGILVCISATATGVYCYESYTEKKHIETVFESLLESWHKKDMETVAKYASTTNPDTFTIETGFEEYEDIMGIIDERIYKDASIEIKSISVNVMGEEQPTGQAKVVVQTYNNLEVINTIITTLLDDSSQVDRNYTHQDFVSGNLEKIKENVASIERDFSKILVVNLQYDDTKKEWTIPFEKNKPFYNVLSGQLIAMTEEVETTTVPNE